MRRALVAIVAALAASACASIVGIGDVPDVSLDAGANAGAEAGVDAGADGAIAPSGDGAADAQSSDSRASDVACVPTGAEICTDGIDNDCDGKTDCEDPACTQQGFA